MLLDEARDALGGHAAVPRSFGVDDHCRAVAADTQTADLGAVASRAKVAFLDLPFQYVPRGQPILRRAAGWAGAEEDVPVITADAALRGGVLELCAFFRHTRRLRSRHDSRGSTTPGACLAQSGPSSR